MVDDALVIGAGPAGSAAAAVLAARGLRVTLLERHALPRSKLCSGVLSPRATRILREALPIEEFVVGTARRTMLTVQGEGGTIEHAHTPLLFSDRARLDEALSLFAARRGAQLRTGARVIRVDPLEGTVILQGGETLRARVLIGADGGNGVCSLGLPEPPPLPGLGIEVRVPDPRGPQDAARLELAVDGGYLWEFPQFDGRVAIGVGSSMRRALPRLPDLLKRHAVTAGIEFGRVHGHPLPWKPNPRPQYGRMLLAGDAAGLLDPLIGEGIPYALWSGILAAQATAEHLQRGAPLARYTELLAQILTFQSPLRHLARLRQHLGVQGTLRLVRQRALREKAFHRIVLREDGFERAAAVLRGG